MRVIQSMNAGLNSSRSATGSWSLGTVAMKRWLKSMLSNSTRRREAAVERVPRGALDRLDVEDRHDLARSGMWDLASTAPGSDRLAAEAARLVLVGVAATRPRTPRSSSPVIRLVPPGQSAAGASRG